MTEQNIYRQQWDRYAVRWKEYAASKHPEILSKEGAWPGDEWGAEDNWRLLFRKMFLDSGAANWKFCVEIGAGSGKYTDYLLSSSDSQILAFDISPEYLKVLTDRLGNDVRSGRLHPLVLRGDSASEMIDEIRSRGLTRQVDAFYSIDAMVHVDLQYLIAYLLTAALTLRVGGYLIMTVPDALSTAGFSSLLKSIVPYYPLQGRATAKFEWLSEDLVRGLLERLGFSVKFVLPYGGDRSTLRDLHVVACLTDPSTPEALRLALGEATSD
jgi:methyltransferase family protein